MEGIISGLIGGVFTLVGVYYGHRLQNRQIAANFSPAEQSAAATKPVKATASVNIGAVIRDVGIIWLLTFAAGVILGFANPRDLDSDGMIAAIALGNIIFGTIGFVISGSRVGSKRWKHLFAVAITFWLSNIINVVLMGLGIEHWLFGLPIVLLMMGVGGSLSYIFNRR